MRHGTWIALSVVAALVIFTDVQVISYAQISNDPSLTLIQGKAVPVYRDCTPRITLVADANDRMEQARLRARAYIGAAMNALSTPPVAGSTVDIALDRHFITPNDAERATINATYRQILDTLAVRNYICNTENICDAQACWGGLTVYNDDLIHISRPFFKLDTTCRAIVLIHEGAHDVGIDAVIGSPHSPNRGDPEYPAGNVAPPAGVTTADRMNTPDAYSFFAAHIWRDTDSGRSCF